MEHNQSLSQIAHLIDANRAGLHVDSTALNQKVSWCSGDLASLEEHASLQQRHEIPINAKQARVLFDGITERESQLLYYLVRGFSLTEISAELSLTRNTIVTYFKNLKNRYRVHSKTELVQRAIDNGFVHFKPVTSH